MSMTEWIASLTGPFEDVLSRISAILPRVIAGLIVLAVAFAVGWALRLTVEKLLERGKHLLPGRALAEGSEVERWVVRLVGALVFWLVALVGAAVAVEVLGLSGLTATLSGFASYLPRIIAAVLEIAGGIIVGNLAAAWVFRTARVANVVYARAAANAVKSGILLVAAVVALTQAGVDSTILVVALGTSLGAFLGAVALAFGLGARTTVSNLIAAHYLQRIYRVNQRIRIGEHQGRILEIRPTEVMLDTAEGVTLVPARRFSEETSVLLGEDS
jgi:small-conductance mechanosensitive channel